MIIRAPEGWKIVYQRLEGAPAEKYLDGEGIFELESFSGPTAHIWLEIRRDCYGIKRFEVERIYNGLRERMGFKLNSEGEAILKCMEVANRYGNTPIGLIPNARQLPVDRMKTTPHARLSV